MVRGCRRTLIRYNMGKRRDIHLSVFDVVEVDAHNGHARGCVDLLSSAAYGVRAVLLAVH